MQIFSFGLGEQATEFSPEVLGGKGAGLVWMDSQGVKVPPGFILPCHLMADYQAKPKTFMKEVAKEIKPWLQKLKDKFGYMPLVSVRSGARQSMPGMMDTILNVGLDTNTFDFWAEKLGTDCATDSRKRLIEMYADVVEGIDRREFHRCKDVESMLEKYQQIKNEPFPMAAMQITGAIEAVFKSWFNERAKIYRQQNGIPEDWGTAVVVQSMVFGNFNENSGTGVLFTRDPNTGENKVSGEFLVNAQGEDVVAGIRTPMPLKDMKVWSKKVAAELLTTVEKLEIAKKDVQDVEFTIQDGELFILQTRNAKRTPIAALRIAMGMLNEGLIDEGTALARVKPREFDQAQQAVLDPSFKKAPFAVGLSACSGVVTGKVVTSSAAAINCKEPCILVTEETNPDDIGGMYASKGIVTMTGGSTCHAAVVARGMNKPCVVGVGMDLPKFMEGMVISMDGATGRIWEGEVPVIDGSKSEAAAEYLQLLRHHKGYIPIVNDVCEGSPQVLFTPGHAITMERDVLIIEKLAQVCERVYVDMRETGTRLDYAEEVFYRLFHSGEGVYLANLSGLLCALPAEVKAKMVTIGSAVTGITCLATINDLNSLIMAEAGQEAIMALPAITPAVTKVLELKAIAGEKLDVVSYGQLMPGQKSFVSDAQVLLSK